MCLISLNWNPEHHYPLILLSNRDELYQRPTRQTDFWPDHSHIFGGQDLLAGGGWLAVSTRGRLAALTNYREPASVKPKSRGELVRRFLTDQSDAETYIQTVLAEQHLYAGFNLLIADHSGLWYCTNRAGTDERSSSEKLTPGLYGLSNHLLDTPWPKVQRLNEGLAKAIANNSLTPQHAFSLLGDRQQPAPEHIPKTAIDPQRERLLAPCFIRLPDYGTRNCAMLMFERDGTLHWHERSYGSEHEGPPSRDLHKVMQVPFTWLSQEPRLDRQTAS